MTFTPKLKGVELIKAAMDHIEKHPDTHYQGDWVTLRAPDGMAVETFGGANRPPLNECKTEFCLAGHMAVIQGYPAPSPYLMWEDPYGSWVVNPKTGESAWDCYNNPVEGPDWEPVHAVMERELPDTSGYLFSGAWSRAGLRVAIDQL
jgi:hypothetical protein